MRLLLAVLCSILIMGIFALPAKEDSAEEDNRVTALKSVNGKVGVVIEHRCTRFHYSPLEPPPVNRYMRALDPKVEKVCFIIQNQPRSEVPELHPECNAGEVLLEEYRLVYPKVFENSWILDAYYVTGDVPKIDDPELRERFEAEAYHMDYHGVLFSYEAFASNSSIDSFKNDPDWTTVHENCDQ